MPASDYFLSSTAMGDDFAFRAPPRPAKVTPLVDGIPTFREMERAIAGATKSVHMAFWVFNPNTPLQAKGDVRSILAKRKIAEKPGTWKALLGAVARAGADVRVIVSDFDPILRDEAHRAAWRTYRQLMAEAGGGKFKGTGGLHALASRHDAKTGMAGSEVAKRLAAVVKKLTAAQLKGMPGLWQNVELKSGKPAIVAAPNYDAYPASHHQKILIVDGQVAFCGGLDVNTGRVDAAPVHGMLWHDLHCRVEGEVAGDLQRAYVSRWNREATQFNAFVAAAKTARPGFSLAAPVAKPVSPAPPAATAVTGPATAQLLRTVSVDYWASTAPSVVRKDVEQAYELVIGKAEKYVYVENQYLRDRRVVQWLIDRAAAKPQLAVIVVLPVAPEEISTPPVDVVTQHGMHLQREALKLLKDTLTTRVGVFSMVLRGAATAKTKAASNWKGSPQIYVHSKGLIVDDVFAIIGSANTTLRSFQVDTEACIGFHDPDTVKAFRIKLWKELLGSPAGLDTWAPADFLPKWNAIATANDAAKPHARSGFIVTHDHLNPTVAGAASSLIPDVFAEAVSGEPHRTGAPV